MDDDENARFLWNSGLRDVADMDGKTLHREFKN